MTSTPAFCPLPRVLVTAGATLEPLDPVRFISNRSSGKQGIYIAKALADAGFGVELVLGVGVSPCLDTYDGRIRLWRVETSMQMFHVMLRLLPVEAIVMCAAICDWRPRTTLVNKMKKKPEEERLTLEFVKNPDILETLGRYERLRPRLLIGFAAETENSKGRLLDTARLKLIRKGCDWLVANNVAPPSAGGSVFGSETASDVWMLSKSGREELWGTMSKSSLARRLSGRVREHLLALTSSAKALTLISGIFLSACQVTEQGVLLAPAFSLAQKKVAIPKEDPILQKIATLKQGEVADFGQGRKARLRKRYMSLAGDRCVVAEVQTGYGKMGADAKAALALEGQLDKPEEEEDAPAAEGVMPASVKGDDLPDESAAEPVLKLVCHHGKWRLYPMYRRFDDEDAVPSS